ncbi:MAG: VWA domain-containing protein [Planctomycetota bacterium]
MSGLRFESPIWLAALPVLVALYWWRLRAVRREAATYSSAELLRDLPRTLAQKIAWLPPALRLIGLVLLVIALARPQQGRSETRIFGEGIAIQMCLDRSGSMRAMDFELDGKRVSRLAAVKHVFRSFVAGDEKDLPGRRDDLIGLVAFGGFAVGRCPLTLDHGALLESLESVKIPEPLRDSRGRIVEHDDHLEELATAIGDAIALGCKRLDEVDAKSKVLVLLSDGKNTAGVIEPLDAADLAKTLGIRVHTIGVGTTGTAPFPGIDFSGRRVLTPQQVEMDAETLRAIAERAGGQFFHADNTAALEQVYADIDTLEKSKTEGRVYTEYRELYAWALLPGAIFLLLELILRTTRFRSLP